MSREYFGISRRLITVSAIRRMSEARSLLRLRFLSISFRGIYNKHPFVILTVFAENHYDGGYLCAKENVGRQTNDGVDVVVLNKRSADGLVVATSEQHSMRQNDGNDTVFLYVIKVMQEEAHSRLFLSVPVRNL